MQAYVIAAFLGRAGLFDAEMIVLKRVVPSFRRGAIYVGLVDVFWTVLLGGFPPTRCNIVDLSGCRAGRARWRCYRCGLKGPRASGCRAWQKWRVHA